MSYEYKKLCDVTLDESPNSPNLLVEDGGEIKRVPVSKVVPAQVQSDFEEDDITDPAFILNKPEQTSGGGANVITYTLSSSTLLLDGVAVNRLDVLDSYINGSILRICVDNASTKRRSIGVITDINYSISTSSPDRLAIEYYNFGARTSLIV